MKTRRMVVHPVSTRPRDPWLVVTTFPAGANWRTSCKTYNDADRVISQVLDDIRTSDLRPSRIDICLWDADNQRYNLYSTEWRAGDPGKTRRG